MLRKSSYTDEEIKQDRIDQLEKQLAQANQAHAEMFQDCSDLTVKLAQAKADSERLDKILLLVKEVERAMKTLKKRPNFQMEIEKLFFAANEVRQAIDAAKE